MTATGTLIEEITRRKARARLSVSLPAFLVAYVKSEAKKHGCSQSLIVEIALEQHRASGASR